MGLRACESPKGSNYVFSTTLGSAHLEGQRDLVSILITPRSHIVTPNTVDGGNLAPPRGPKIL